MVSYFDHWMSVVRLQKLLLRTFPKILTGLLPNLTGMILIWPSLLMDQMVPVRCISRSHRLKIDFRDENFKNEPVHEISNNVVCATSKASDQPAHTRSLIRAFASRLSIL